MGVKWALIVILISIFLVADDSEHLFMCIGHLCILCGEISIQICYLSLN
jgi:hypothetical protein